jgi:hypothetical protein
VVRERVLDGRTDQAAGSLLRNGLDADGAGSRKADGLHSHPGLKKLDHLASILAPGLVLDAGIDILGILAEDDHVDFMRSLDRRRHAGEVANRPDTGVEIQLLAQGHIQGAKPTADGGRERPLDGDQIPVDRGKRFVRQPAAGLILRLFPGEHLEPGNPAAASIGPTDGAIKDMLRGRPDVGAGPISLDEGNDRLSRYLQAAIAHRDCFPAGVRVGLVGERRGRCHTVNPLLRKSAWVWSCRSICSGDV